MPKFNEVKADKTGFSYTSQHGVGTICSFDLFLIRQAYDRGCDFEDLADGYGPGQGTRGDWSGIRDSTDGAVERMLERALNHLFG